MRKVKKEISRDLGDFLFLYQFSLMKRKRMDKTMGQILTWKAKEKNVFTRAQGKKVREKELVLASDCRKIEDEALMNNVKIKRVQIPSSVTEVGKQSFANCTALNELCFDNIERIKQEAFSCCIRVSESRIFQKTAVHWKRCFFSV